MEWRPSGNTAPTPQHTFFAATPPHWTPMATSPKQTGTYYTPPELAETILDFDDIHDDRFRRHAPEVIKDEHIPYAEYPCIVLSMNADARNFQPEIVKRSLMIWTTTSLPGNAITSIRQLRRSVTGITNWMSTALYRRYLSETRELLDRMDEQDIQDTDVLEVSSDVLCRLFEEHLQPGERLPE